jgi:hypothetical protein
MIEGAAREHGGPDFLGGDGEEERHENVVDEVVKGDSGGQDGEARKRNLEVAEREVTSGVEIGPGEAGRRPEDEEEGVFGDEMDETRDGLQTKLQNITERPKV